MVQADSGKYEYHKESGALAAMQAGKDDGVQVDAWTVAELAYVEIQADGAGSFAGYDALALGGIPEPHRRNGKGKISGDIQAGDPDGDGTIDDVKDGAEVRIRLTDYSHTDTIAKSEWFNVNDLEQNDAGQLPTMQFAGLEDAEFAKGGRHVVVEYRNKRLASQASYSDSKLAFPFIGARDSVN